MGKVVRQLWMVPLLGLAGCFADGYETTQAVAMAPTVSALVVGNEIALGGEGSAGARLTYYADGRYRHRDASSSSSGRYAVDGGRVCVTFSTGEQRCDTYMRRNGQYFFVNSGDGRMFPVVSVQRI